MSDKSHPKQEPVVPADRDGAMWLMWSMADTTWRMFTPPAILVSLGIFTDLKFQTKPWITLLGVVVGLGLSVLLVKQQLRKSK